MAGERFRRAMKNVDPVTSEIFGKIAEEEIAHIELAQKYFQFEIAPKRFERYAPVAER